MSIVSFYGCELPLVPSFSLSLSLSLSVFFAPTPTHLLNETLLLEKDRYIEKGNVEEKNKRNKTFGDGPLEITQAYLCCSLRCLYGCTEKQGKKKSPFSFSSLLTLGINNATYGYDFIFFLLFFVDTGSSCNDLYVSVHPPTIHIYLSSLSFMGLICVSPPLRLGVLRELSIDLITPLSLSIPLSLSSFSTYWYLCVKLFIYLFLVLFSLLLTLHFLIHYRNLYCISFAPPSIHSSLVSPCYHYCSKHRKQKMRAMDILYDARDTFLDEVRYMRDDVKNTKASFATFFAIFCFGIVLVGNVVLLIAINFWLSIMPTDNLDHNSSQIAIQVVSMMFMLIFFTSFVVTFIGMYGVRPLIRTLVGSGRVGGPWYRLFLLFSSGATNAISSILSVYAITYTPQFLQAILLCAIPFSAQAWTVIFIPLERKRNYVSVFFVGSFLFFIGGIFLASTKAFTGEHERASVPWTLIYLASSVVFGLWCVVQRLYLDAVVFKAVEHQAIGDDVHKNGDHSDDVHQQLNDMDEEMDNEVIADDVKQAGALSSKSGNNNEPFQVQMDEENNDEGVPHQRQWAQQDVYDTAAKLVLLYVGVFFQTLVTFVCFPVDAIPWFGTSDTVGDAWAAFADSVNFIFDSWFNVRYGLLYSLGFAMSFIGCTYLNEHSPTLASVVLQLAGPVTSFMIVIVPKWNVYQEDYDIGQQMGGIILLLVAAALYHFWDQHTSRALYGGGLEGDQQQAGEADEEEGQLSGNEERSLHEIPRERHGAVNVEESLMLSVCSLWCKAFFIFLCRAALSSTLFGIPNWPLHLLIYKTDKLKLKQSTFIIITRAQYMKRVSEFDVYLTNGHDVQCNIVIFHICILLLPLHFCFSQIRMDYFIFHFLEFFCCVSQPIFYLLMYFGFTDNLITIHCIYQAETTELKCAHYYIYIYIYIIHTYISTVSEGQAGAELIPFFLSLSCPYARPLESPFFSGGFVLRIKTSTDGVSPHSPLSWNLWTPTSLPPVCHQSSLSLSLFDRQLNLLFLIISLFLGFALLSSIELCLIVRLFVHSCSVLVSFACVASISQTSILLHSFMNEGEEGYTCVCGGEEQKNYSIGCVASLGLSHAFIVTHPNLYAIEWFVMGFICVSPPLRLGVLRELSIDLIPSL
eukprot:gene7455-5252_t